MLGDQPTGKSVSYTADLVQGVKLKRLRIGLGIGFDSFARWQTMPLFGQVSYDVLGKKNVIYVQGSYGFAYARKLKEEWEAPSSDTGGAMLKAMLGYRINVENVRLNFAIGYRFQNVNSSSDIWTFAPGDYTIQTREDINRLVFTMGLGLW